MFSLAGEDFIMVTLQRRRLCICFSGREAVTFALGVGDERAQRASVAIEFRRPVKPILFSRRTHELLSVFQNLVSIAVEAGVIALCVHVCAEDAKRRELVLADAASEDFILARLGIEEPAAILPHQRNREWVEIVTNFQNHFPVRD